MCHSQWFVTHSMMLKLLFFVGVLQTNILLIYSQTTSTSIPITLQQCYRRNFSSTIPRVPNNIQVLVELIRKLEHDPTNVLNMRMLSTSIFYAARLDGIEESQSGFETNISIPYRASGKQFNKFNLLANHFISGNAERFSYNALSTEELCILHDLISSTLNAWERGNERTTCEVRSMSQMDGRNFVNMTTRQRSRCPVEKGVIKTRWGAISPGHLISGVVAAFEESKVTLQAIIEDLVSEFNITTDYDSGSTVKINNILVATAVGDIAEMILNQALKTPTFGEVGHWNNSIYPREYYVNEERWDITHAELLGGLDALILSTKIKEWTSILSSTRLSQVLDMYYSERGVGFEHTYRACERKSKLVSLFRDFNFIEQSAATAKLLQKHGQFNQLIADPAIDKSTRTVVADYNTHAADLSSHYDACEQGGDNITNLEIITILDGTWQPEEVFTIISYLTELTDVSYYGSKLGIINGQTGNWIANVTGDIIQIFGQLGNVTNWPTRLQLSDSLNAVTQYYQNKTAPDCTTKTLRPMGHVVLVLANTALVADVDSQLASRSIQTLKASHPDLRIIYVASETSTTHYQKFTENTFNNDLVISSNNDIATFVNLISEKLSHIPANIVNFYCNTTPTEKEDYVTPQVDTLYEIHADYIRRSNILVEFKGNDYGDLSICAFDSNKIQNRFCKSLTGFDEVTFNVRDHCFSTEPCTVQFAISANTTKNKCAEMDCRYPDQVRLDVRTSWTSSGSLRVVNLMILWSSLALLVKFW